MAVQWDNGILDTHAEHKGCRLHVVSTHNRRWLAFVDETIVAGDDGWSWFATKAKAQAAASKVANRKVKLRKLDAPKPCNDTAQINQ